MNGSGNGMSVSGGGSGSGVSVVGATGSAGGRISKKWGHTVCREGSYCMS